MNNSASQFHSRIADHNSSGQDRLRPDLKAAIAVAIFLIGFEILGDLLPFVGYLITFPISLVVYYLQGLMTGLFIKRDPRYLSISPWGYARLGFTSSLWTGVVFSLILTILSYLVTTPATLGFSLMEIPFTLLTILLDLVSNLILTTLTAWLFGVLNHAAFVSVSCLLLISVLGLACFADILLGIGITRILANIIPHLPSYFPFLRH